MSKHSSSWLAILATVGCSSVATFSTVWVMVSGLWALPSLLRLGLNDITQREFPQRNCPHRDSYAISNSRQAWLPHLRFYGLAKTVPYGRASENEKVVFFLLRFSNRPLRAWNWKKSFQVLSLSIFGLAKLRNTTLFLSFLSRSISENENLESHLESCMGQTRMS